MDCQPLFPAENNPSFGEVIGGHLKGHSITGQDTDEVHPHLAGNMGCHQMPGLDLDPEHGPGEKFLDNTFDTNYIIFGHVKISG